MVNIIMRLFGLGKAVDALDGESSKAYAGAVGQILTGAAGVLGGLAMFAAQFVQSNGGSEYLDILKGVAHNPATAAIMAGVALVSNGLSVIGQRHAVAKAVAQAPSTPPVA